MQSKRSFSHDPGHNTDEDWLPGKVAAKEGTEELEKADACWLKKIAPGMVRLLPRESEVYGSI
jgi:hypothetical protein